MTKKLLLKLTPLEPYFFGDENTIRFDRSNSYFVSSLNRPSAMTVMGMLRYTLLEQAGFLNINGCYSEEERKRNEAYIGDHSFSPGASDDYGVILRVSPLFLMKQDSMYVKLPRNHRFSKENQNYTPIKMGNTFHTSFGEISLPQPGELSGKETVSDEMYMNVDNGNIERVFFDVVKVTNNTKLIQDGFLKKNYKMLKEGFCFAATVELKEQATLTDTVCYMGREKSAFLMQVTELPQEFSIEERLFGSYFKKFHGFCYAFGDVMLAETPNYTAFAMVRFQNLRYLQTVSDKNGALGIYPSTTLNSVITAGSIFCCASDVKPYGSDRFGMNQIITLGG